jgi:hypothetical protein
MNCEIRSEKENNALVHFIQAYERMALKAKYRPAAPGDGLGGIYLSAEQLADRDLLRKEAINYAKRFRAEEDKGEFSIGCSDYETSRAFVYAIEAARLLCAGFFGQQTAKKLCKMAAREITKIRKQRKEREKCSSKSNLKRMR